MDHSTATFEITEQAIMIRRMIFQMSPGFAAKFVSIYKQMGGSSQYIDDNINTIVFLVMLSTGCYL